MSFTYFQDEEDFAEWSNEDAVDVESDIEESADGLDGADLESHRSSFVSKRLSRDSVEHPLLSRFISASSFGRDRRTGGRLNQKVYIASEDLTAVFAGFSTSTGGYALYLTLCLLTGGLAYLLFRWLPRWRVRLVGKVTPLAKCQWIAIEVRAFCHPRNCAMLTSGKDQWNQFTIHEVDNQSYGRPLSTVFVEPPGHIYDEDTDPTMAHLRFLDYRHMRFCYHPTEDKFALISGWKDPSWTNARVMRVGLDADERDSREQIFGQNVIDIQQKTVPQLLVDEVCDLERWTSWKSNFLIPFSTGLSSFLHVPSGKPFALVRGRVLLLCRLHFPHLCFQYCDHRVGDKIGMLLCLFKTRAPATDLDTDYAPPERDFPL